MNPLGSSQERPAASRLLASVPLTVPPGRSAEPKRQAIYVSDTSSSEKRREFMNHFPGMIPGSFLSFMARPPEPELEGSAQGNAVAKSEHARKLSRVPSWLQMADVLAAKGVIPHDVAVDLGIWHRSRGKIRLENYRQPALAGVRGFADEQAIWNYLRSAAVALGEGAAYDRIVSTPLYVLTDDSQTKMWLKTGQGNVPLTFALLDRVIGEIESDPGSAAKYRDVLVLRNGIRSVAAYLQAARQYQQIESGEAPSDPYSSREAAWKYYIRQLGGSALLGVDGAPIASVLGPEKVVRGLHSLAKYLGASIGDIHVDSESNVNATRVYQPAGANHQERFSSSAVSTSRFQPWPTIARTIDQGNIGVHLSDVLVVNPEAPPEKHLTVTDFITSPGSGPADLTGRGKALLKLREQMKAAGIAVPEGRGAHQHQRLRALNQGDTVRIVIPDQATEIHRSEYRQRVLEAWRLADVDNNPRIEFVRLGDAARNPDVSWKLLGSTAVFLVDPSTAGGSRKDVLNFVRLAKELEINGTVGQPVHGQTPTFVIGDSRDPRTGAGIAREAMGSLYVHGRAPNPIESIFSSWDILANVVQAYWRTAVIRPADSNLPRISSPLALAEPLKKQRNEVVFALYGSAKEYVDPKYPRQVRELMNAAVESHARKDGNGKIVRETFVAEGSDLRALGKRLGVVPPSDRSSDTQRADYYRRLDAAIQMMPGVVVASRKSLARDGVRYDLLVPVMRRPVIFSHGGGLSPFDGRLVDDPTMNIMGAFNGLYLARIDGQKSIRLVDGSNRGVTTPPLEQKEGRPTLLPTNERIYTDHIMQRTMETQRGAHVAFSTYGGIGTDEEKLYFPGVLVLIEGSNFSNSRAAQLRTSAGLKTIILDPEDDRFKDDCRRIMEAAPNLDPNGADFERSYAKVAAGLRTPQRADSGEQSHGGVVVRPELGTSEERHQREIQLGANWAAVLPPDRSPQRLQELLRKTPNESLKRIELPNHTGHAETLLPRLPQTTAHEPGAGKYEPITVLAQAISQLSATGNARALMRQWSAAPDAPMLRALLTRNGLTQVLQYGLGGALAQGLSQRGLSRYFSDYKTVQLLKEISQANPALARQARGLIGQVQNVLLSRREALTATGSRHAADVSRPADHDRLRQAVERLMRASTSAQRVDALRQLRAQVSDLNRTLTTARAAQMQEHQTELDLARVQLGKMQTWLVDPQRLQDASQMSQALWQGLAVVLAGLASGVSTLLWAREIH